MSQQSKEIKADASDLLVINLRGIVNTKYSVRTALDQMGIIRRFSATIVPDTSEIRGVLNLAKNNVAWSQLDSATRDTLQKIASHGDGKTGGRDNKGKSSNDEQKKRRIYRLNSPRGGFKRSIRRQYGQGGILGPNPKLSELVSAMTHGK